MPSIDHARSCTHTLFLPFELQLTPTLNSFSPCSPLREANGEVAYFIGSQTNVTGTLTSSKSLAFLTAGSHGSKTERAKTLVNDREVSSGYGYGHFTASWLSVFST